MKDALSYIVGQLVDDKDQVSITEGTIDGVVTYQIGVAKDDIGKVIGKEGKIIRAIRNVMKIPSIKQEKRINIVLVTE